MLVLASIRAAGADLSWGVSFWRTGKLNWSTGWAVGLNRPSTGGFCGLGAVSNGGGAAGNRNSGIGFGDLDPRPVALRFGELGLLEVGGMRPKRSGG